MRGSRGAIRDWRKQRAAPRLWRLSRRSPADPGALGLWRARDAAEMEAIVRTLPLDSWMTTDITPLSTHPSDPVLAPS